MIGVATCTPNGSTVKCTCPVTHFGTGIGASGCSLCSGSNRNCDQGLSALTCEIDINTNIGNCGACGTVCSSNNILSLSCAGGVCNGACQVGFADCNNNKQTDGCETPTTSDPNRCGSCSPCVLPNAVAGCASSTCTIASCNAGFASCNGLAADGCETPTTSDPNRCGSCSPCVLPNAVAGCASSTCTIASCNAGFADCNGLAADGCETSGACLLTGIVWTVSMSTVPISLVPCANGAGTTCTRANAISSCTNVGMRLLSHASDSGSGIFSLGATVSCQWSVGYYRLSSGATLGDCLIGMSNVLWSDCCGTGGWHGNTLTVPTTANTQFGYIHPTNSGYQAGFSNVFGTNWGCQSPTSAPSLRSGCTRYLVACTP